LDTPAPFSMGAVRCFANFGATMPDMEISHRPTMTNKQH
jgi:hypothetical protein